MLKGKSLSSVTSLTVIDRSCQCLTHCCLIMLSLLALATVFYSALHCADCRVISFQPDDTAECLADSTRKCDNTRTCTYRTYHPSCLEAPIPYSSLDHDRVACCFKCCHHHFLQYNKINVNKTLFEENQKYLPEYNLKSLHRDTNILLSNSRLYQFSHAIKVDDFNSQTQTNVLVYPSYKITTFKDFNHTVYDLASKNTKRAIFIDLENECVPRETLRGIGSALSAQNIHLVSMLFARHLACPLTEEGLQSSGGATRGRLLRIVGGDGPLRGKNKKSRNPFADTHPGHSRPRLNSKDLQHVFSLIPYGVRSTLAASEARSSEVTTKSHPRSITLDCSCANQYRAGRDLIKGSKQLQKLCTYNSNFSPADADKPSIDEFNQDQMTELVKYYRFLPSTKFVLSPANDINQSYCEWEALAFGAIPVIQAPRMASEMMKLFLGLPVHIVPTFENMDDRYMTQLHSTYIEDLYSPNSRYSFSKLYHPYWLSLMKNLFTYGKPAQRPWRRVDLAYKKTNVDSCLFEGSKKSKPGAVGAATNPYSLQNKVEKNLPERFKNMVPSAKKTLYSRRALATSSLTSVRQLGQEKLNKTILQSVSLRRQLSDETISSKNIDLIELVLPRCCESGLYELDWLTQLLAVTPPGSLSVSIYYKCLECLPASLAYKWLGQEDIMFESDYDRKHNFTSGSKRITLLDDSSLVAFGTERVKQYPLFDRIHNGKEVTAYLKYIIDNYQQLPKQVVFLHTSPHAHLHLPLFTKFIKYFLTCEPKSIPPVDFLHLNVHYKSAGWGQCCGKKGRCRESTWNYLFGEYPEMGSDYMKASTYSSAQFVASRGAIVRWPVSFWQKMVYAINGEHDLDGCPHSSDPNTPSWGGHQLTGQYERMWHIIFGKNRHQTPRKHDMSLPYVLRMDCMDADCKGGAL